MRIYIPQALKNEVLQRADYQCEYCRLSEFLSYFTFHVEHIRPLKHGGKTVSHNLALSCPDCNYFKGSDIGTYPDVEEFFVRFFNPRRDKWEEHFTLEDATILGTSDIGRATERIFKFRLARKINCRCL